MICQTRLPGLPLQNVQGAKEVIPECLLIDQNACTLRSTLLHYQSIFLPCLTVSDRSSQLSQQFSRPTWGSGCSGSFKQVIWVPSISSGTSSIGASEVFSSLQDETRVVALHAAGVKKARGNRAVGRNTQSSSCTA